MAQKSTGCSYRGLRLDSQYPHGSLKHSGTLVPGYLGTPQMFYTAIEASKTAIQISKRRNARSWECERGSQIKAKVGVGSAVTAQI